LADIGEYSYNILYQLEDFPQVKLVIPLGITIQSPRVSQILISPQPASTYSVSAGTDLILSFEVTNPQIKDILIEVHTGKADSFTKVEIQQQGSEGTILLKFYPTSGQEKIEAMVKVTASEICGDCLEPLTTKVSFTVSVVE
jgi:hypothetical protein